MRTIGQEQVLTTGGATRLVDRMEAAALVERVTDPADRRGRLVRLTPLGEDSAVRISRLPRYPDNGMLIAAQLGAKVAKGEMTWG